MATVNKDFRVKNNINLTNTADTITVATHYFVETGSDGVIRPKTLANVRTEIVTTAAVNAAAATTVGTITSGTWQGSVISATYIDTAIARLASPTFTGTVILPTSATGGASIQIPHGTAPTAPTNGDIWTTTAGVYARINGSTVGPFGSASQEVYYQTTAPASPTTGTIWIDSDETTSFLNTNDFALKASPTFTGTVAAPIINASGLITANAGIAAESWTKDDITTRTQSGFIQTSTATTGEGWPETTNSWYHLISSTHSNTSNYYSLQLSAPFYSNKLYFRSTNGVGTASWSEVATVTYVNENSGGLNPFLLGGM